jgi:hypothetical protein
MFYAGLNHRDPSNATDRRRKREIPEMGAVMTLPRQRKLCEPMQTRPLDFTPIKAPRLRQRYFAGERLMRAWLVPQKRTCSGHLGMYAKCR